MIKKIWFVGFVFAVMLLMTACGSSSESGESSGSSDTLVIVDWGGVMTEARKKPIFEPFEKEHNVKIQVESPTDYGKFKAMVESGNVSWDVVNVDTYWGIQAGEEGLLEPLDFNIINKENIMPETITDYLIGAELYSATIGFSTEAFPDGNHPKSWADFWDVEKFPGARALYGDPIETLEIALLADGVKPEELYPLDVDRAFNSLDKLKSQTEIVFWDAGAQPTELLSTGSVTASSVWNGRITTAQAEGAPVDQVFNQALLSSEGWVVPKGSKNKELAMKFIAFATQAEIQAEFSKTIDYSPANLKAVELLPEDVQKRLGQSPEQAKTQVVTDTQWWVENFEEVKQRFQEWQLKN